MPERSGGQGRTGRRERLGGYRDDWERSGRGFAKDLEASWLAKRTLDGRAATPAVGGDGARRLSVRAWHLAGLGAVHRVTRRAPSPPERRAVFPGDRRSAPNPRGGPGARSGRRHPAVRAAAMPALMRRNSSRRSAWTRLAASRSVSAAAARYLRRIPAVAVAVLGGEQAGAVEVEETGKAWPGPKRLTSPAKRPRDVVVAEPLAHHVGVLALDERVVVRVPRPGLGEPLDAKLVEQRRDAVVDVLAAVVGAEAEDGEREGPRAGPRAAAPGSASEMPTAAPTNSCWVTSSTRLIRYRALHPVTVALVDRVDADVAPVGLRARGLVAGRSPRSWPASSSTRCAWRGKSRCRAGCRRVRPNRREAFEPRLAEHFELPPQDFARGQPGHLTEGLVDFRQQPDVRRRADPGSSRSPATAGPSAPSA